MVNCSVLRTVRLACVRHTASVHPEPGSNSQSFERPIQNRQNSIEALKWAQTEPACPPKLALVRLGRSPIDSKSVGGDQTLKIFGFPLRIKLRGISSICCTEIELSRPVRQRRDNSVFLQPRNY